MVPEEEAASHMGNVSAQRSVFHELAPVSLSSLLLVMSLHILTQLYQTAPYLLVSALQHLTHPPPVRITMTSYPSLQS